MNLCNVFYQHRLSAMTARKSMPTDSVMEYRTVRIVVMKIPSSVPAVSIDVNV